MWYITILLGLTCTGIVMSDPRVKLQMCLENADTTELENFAMMDEFPPLESVCPVALDILDCIDNVIQEELNMTIADIAASHPETEVGKGAKIFVNIRSIIVDICTDGSDLNEAYEANIHCLQNLDIDDTKCHQKTHDAVSAYYDIANAVDEEGYEEEYQEHLDISCLSVAYMSACAASYIHDKCGEDAFNFFRTVVKRSSLIQTGICSEEQLAEVKTDFLESLKHEEKHHQDLFKSVFDLRRRKREVLFM